MADSPMQEMVDNALELLPKSGEWVEFDKYKENLYSKNPSKGKDVFTHILKRDLAKKKLDVGVDGKAVVFLSRLS